MLGAPAQHARLDRVDKVKALDGRLAFVYLARKQVPDQPSTSQPSHIHFLSQNSNKLNIKLTKINIK
jgi:hypothetical protein